MEHDARITQLEELFRVQRQRPTTTQAPPFAATEATPDGADSDDGEADLEEELDDEDEEDGEDDDLGDDDDDLDDEDEEDQDEADA